MSEMDMLIRLALATLIGGIIGYERGYNNRPAGFRTHILVCIGAATISMLQISAVNEIIMKIQQDPLLSEALKVDIGRMGAQVISGIGFLGAGTILQQKKTIQGLTTAASLWSVACIGLAIGMGYYFLSGAAAVFILLSLTILKAFEDRYLKKVRTIKLEIFYKDRADMTQKLEEFFRSKDIKVKNIEFSIEHEDESDEKSSLYTVIVPKQVNDSDLIQKLVTHVDIKKANII